MLSGPWALARSGYQSLDGGGEEIITSQHSANWDNSNPAHVPDHMFLHDRQSRNLLQVARASTRLTQGPTLGNLQHQLGF